MEAATVIRSSSTIYPPPNLSVKSGFQKRTDSICFGAKLNFSRKGSISGISNGERRLGLGGRRRSSVIRASSSSSSSSGDSPIAPLQLESPIGQFLAQILKSHPHLVPAAVEKQLDQLQTDRDAENAASTGTDLVLYKRIAEVKANERTKALEEILYALVVQKFMDADVSLVPSISPTSNSPSGQVDAWPNEEGKLKELHSEEAYEMIKNHLSLILGNRLADSNSVAQIGKLRVGQVYAASVMYGYFLKRVDQRFQLEKSMKVLRSGSEEEDSDIMKSVKEELRQQPNGRDDVRRVEPTPHPEVSWTGSFPAGGVADSMKPSRLRSYVMSFDSDTLQKYATIRSKEAVSIIEKHTEALFGRPEIVITPQGTIDTSKDESIKISFGGLKRLVLEAVTFGSFLWDVESHVDSRYHFVMS